MCTSQKQKYPDIEKVFQIYKIYGNYFVISSQMRNV